MIERLTAGWRAFWFTPVAPTNLALSRVFFFLGLTLFYLPHDFSGWGDVSFTLYQPIWLFDFLGLSVLSIEALNIVQVVWKLSLACACIGLYTRTSMTVAAILGTYLLGLGHNFGQTYHFDAILVLALWILAFSRAGDAWSVDAQRQRRDPAAPSPSSEYHWPIQLVLVTLALVFFAAGVAKLRASGISWFTSDHLAIMLDRVQYHIADAEPWFPWGSTVARIPYAANIMAFTTIFFETAYPLALFSRRLRAVMVLGGIALIIGIRALMGPTFENFLLINLFWVPWDKVEVWIRRLIDVPSLGVTMGGAPVSAPVPSEQHATELR